MSPYKSEDHDDHRPQERTDQTIAPTNPTLDAGSPLREGRLKAAGQLLAAFFFRASHAFLVLRNGVSTPLRESVGAVAFEFAPLLQKTRSLGVLMALTIGLLIAPSMQHRIVEEGQDTIRIHGIAGLFAGIALLPFGISLRIDVYIVFEHAFNIDAAMIAGGSFCALAMLLWFVVGFSLRLRLKVAAMSEKEEPTSLSTQIEQMLTEARVIVPGAQALLGFQLVVAFTRAFEDLDPALKVVHVTALCFVAAAILLLMTPAALHVSHSRAKMLKHF